MISVSSQKKLREYIEFLKFDIAIKKIKKFKLVKNLKASTDLYQISYEILLSIGAFEHKISVQKLEI